MIIHKYFHDPILLIFIFTIPIGGHSSGQAYRLKVRGFEFRVSSWQSTLAGLGKTLRRGYFRVTLSRSKIFARFARFLAAAVGWQTRDNMPAVLANKGNRVTVVEKSHRSCGTPCRSKCTSTESPQSQTETPMYESAQSAT